jgi:glycolate oxidase
VRSGGSISGEHGIGSDKRCYLDWMFGADDLATMQLVRQAFDPDRRANPGKIFPTPRSCGESLRRRQQLVRVPVADRAGQHAVETLEVF